MSYTAKIIRKYLFFYLAICGISLLFAGPMGNDGILVVGLVGLIVGALLGGGLILAALVIAGLNKDREFPSSEVSGAGVVDAPEANVVISAGERGKAHLLAGLLIVLIGGSLCYGSLTLGPGFSVH